MKFSTFLLPLCVAGIVSAQTAASPQPAPPSHESHARRAHGDMVARLSARLNRTPDQQNQARTIFQQARAEAKALSPKLKNERVALRTAIKSDNEPQIDRILHQDSQLNAQARAVHAKAMAKFYQILNPDQKAQFDKMSEHMGMRNHRAAAPSAGEAR
jgi:Spy/CpxP family protein refolding chaperone